MPFEPQFDGCKAMSCTVCRSRSLAAVRRNLALCCSRPHLISLKQLAR